MRNLLLDIQYGFRVLRKSPGYTLLACLALALGIGANTALFSAVYGVLLKPLPYANGKRIVLLQQQSRGSEVPIIGTSVKEFQDYRAQSQVFDNLVEYHTMNFILLGREPDRVQTGVVSYNFFDLLGVKPLLGRTFTRDDDKTGAAPVLLLSYKYWKQNHGGDTNIVGKAFKMNDRMHTVIGVLPPIPQFPRENDVYMPVVACPFRMSERIISNRSARMLAVVFGTLKPGATLPQAQADSNLIAARFIQDHPENYKNVKNFGVSVDSLHSQLTQRARPMLLMLLATAGLVLLISCANVANLTLARMTQRKYEMAIRVSMGASRSRLAQQVLTECSLISLGGGLIGLLFASAGTSMLATFMARFTPRAEEIQIDASVLIFSLLISVATGILFGIAPALTSSRQLSESLQTGSRSSGAGHTGLSLRNALIVGQVCVSFVLLVFAGLTLRSFANLQKVEAGYDADNVVTMTLPFNFTKYENAAAVSALHERVLEQLRQLPGVVSVGTIAALPLNGPTPFMQPMSIENRQQDPNAAKPEVDVTPVSDGLFKAMGVPLIRGRDFSRADTPESEKTTIISASTAKRHWGTEDPIGRRISLDGGKQWLNIVGVVGDVKYFGLDSKIIDEVYLPYSQNPGPGTLVVRTPMDATAMGNQVTELVHSIDPDQPVSDITTLMQIRSESLASPKVTSMLLSAFAGLALVLAATGLFGVISFLVNLRTREIGIRIALGAKASSVLMMIMSQGLRMVLIGLTLGIVGALAATGIVKSLLFGVSTTDWITFVSVSTVLLTAAMLASYLPARRASQVDPMVALRYE
jgi:putative ABC transport system permease protein